MADDTSTPRTPSPSHPTGQAICAKGRAAPGLVSHPERLTYPPRRTRLKGDPDPGWERIGWDEALFLTAAAMRRAAEQHGPHADAFTISSPSTTAIPDSSGFIQRLANAFGTPYTNITLNVCGWGAPSPPATPTASAASPWFGSSAASATAVSTAPPSV